MDTVTGFVAHLHFNVPPESWATQASVLVDGRMDVYCAHCIFSLCPFFPRTAFFLPQVHAEVRPQAHWPGPPQRDNRQTVLR